MKKIAGYLALALLVSGMAVADEIQAPSFTDGDWWKIKNTVVMEVISRGGFCYDKEEYLVKIENGSPKVYSEGQELDCPEIVGRLLGVSVIEKLTLPFPLTTGKLVKFRTKHFPFEDITIKVIGKEEIPINGILVSAYRIEREIMPLKGANYFHDILLYSTECKCIAVFDRDRSNAQTGVSVKVKQKVAEYKITQ